MSASNLVNFSGFRKYSTSEQVVGEWIDGKPIYQKTVSFGVLPNATQKLVAHGIEDIKMIISCEGIAYNATLSKTLNLEFNATYNAINVCVVTGEDLSGYMESYITLKYTKTTD